MLIKKLRMVLSVPLVMHGHRRWRPNFRLLVVVCLLFFLGLASQAHETGTSWEPSRRVSTCRYVIGFIPFSNVLTEDAKRVIVEASLEARRRGSDRVGLLPYQPMGEPEILSKIHMDVVTGELTQNGIPESKIFRDKISDLPQGKPQISLSICGRPDKGALSRPPANPDYLVLFDMGIQGKTIRIAVPLRYLRPYYWWNTPLEPMHEYSMELRVGLPGFQDEMSDVMRRCEAHEIGACDDIVLINVESPRLDDDSFNPRIIPESDWLRLPGNIHGVSFFYSKSKLQLNPFLEMRTKQNEILFGYCGANIKTNVTAQVCALDRWVDTSLAM